MHTVRRLLATGSTLVLAASAALAVSTGSAAAATCGGSCNGLDPYKTGCASSGAYVVVSSPRYRFATNNSSWDYGYVQLWWSDTCQTNWARTVVLGSGSVTIDSAMYIDTQYHPGKENDTQNTTIGYSPMINGAGVLAETQANVYNASGPIGYATAAQPGF